VDAHRPAHLNRAQELIAVGDLGTARDALAMLLADGHLDVETAELAARVHEWLGDRRAAAGVLADVVGRFGPRTSHLLWLGRLHAQLDELGEALAHFDRAIVLDPTEPGAHFGRGNVLRGLFRGHEAIEAYRRVLPLHPDYANQALLAIAMQQQAHLDFDDARISFQQHYLTSGGSFESIARRVAVEFYTWPPTDLAALAQMVRTLGAHYAATAPRHPLPPPRGRSATDRLRIGLLSADLWSHPVGYFLESLLASSAAHEAEWYVYDSRHPSPDPLAARLRGHADVWHEVVDWPDERLAAQIRLDGIDVLVDLSGYSLGSRLPSLVSRPAPLQLTWLGFHTTTGLPFLDAMIADPYCVREGEDHFFTEPLLRLPHTRHCYTAPPTAPPVAPAPARGRGAVTFGCFQYGPKVGPQVLQAWSRVAAALPDARWIVGLATLDPRGEERLRRRFAEAGFSPRHLEVLPRRSHEDYLAGYADVDVALDTFPFPGGTTTAEALWMGVPTLTLSMPGMIGRQGEQMMTNAGMPEWVTESIDDYVERAIEVGREAGTATWAEQRTSIRERLQKTPLFDGEQFGRDWMDAVRSLWQRTTRERDAADHAVRQRLIEMVESGSGTRWFFVPDHAKESGGVKLIYDQVRCLNRHGHRAVIVHRQDGFVPTWLLPFFEQDSEGRLVDVPVVYGAPSDIPVQPWDTALIPEGFPDIMTDQHLVASTCHRVVLCQNWFYVLNVLPVGVTWEHFGIRDCLSVSQTQTDYLRELMPELRYQQVVGHVSNEVFHPPDDPAVKRLRFAFIPSRDGGLKSDNVIKTFHALHPDLRHVEFVELSGMPVDVYAAVLRESAFYAHFDETSSWGTAPIEAFLSGCLVAGWDGVGGREYLSEENAWLAPNGDIVGLARAMGRLVREHLAGSIPRTVDEHMAAATRLYTLDAEERSVLAAHAALSANRLSDLRAISAVT
jgi:predicted O-linked N-acetylglucosamine transferase (SPINDLY family)